MGCSLNLVVTSKQPCQIVAVWLFLTKIFASGGRPLRISMSSPTVLTSIVSSSLDHFIKAAGADDIHRSLALCQQCGVLFHRKVLDEAVQKHSLLALLGAQNLVVFEPSDEDWALFGGGAVHQISTVIVKVLANKSGAHLCFLFRFVHHVNILVDLEKEIKRFLLKLLKPDSS